MIFLFLITNGIFGKMAKVSHNWYNLNERAWILFEPAMADM